MSLLGAMMSCASMGLEPNTPLGHAYLIPFKRNRKIQGRWVETYDCQLVIGYKGMIQLALRSDKVKSLHADVVREGDQFSFSFGTDQHLRHTYAQTGRGDPIYAYCYAKLSNDGEAFCVMPWEEVLQRRDQSQGYQQAVKVARERNKPVDHPWVKHASAMGRKSAVRGFFDEMPIAMEGLRQAMEVDEGSHDFAGFAADPTAGLPPADTGDVIEGDLVEREPEQKKEPEQSQSPERRPAQTKDKTPPPTKSKPASSKPAAKAKQKDGDPPEFVELADRIIADVEEGSADMLDQVVETWSDMLTALEAEAPAQHQRVQDAIAAINGDG